MPAGHRLRRRAAKVLAALRLLMAVTETSASRIERQDSHPLNAQYVLTGTSAEPMTRAYSINLSAASSPQIEARRT